ncbi:MAG: hypothetical protein V1927_05800 [Candidatus Omnitrophota bacterium]
MFCILKKAGVIFILALFFQNSFAAEEWRGTFLDGDTWKNPGSVTAETKPKTVTYEEFVSAQKTAYIRGLYEGLDAEGIIVNKKSGLSGRIPSLGAARLVNELDEFYKEYYNTTIPVINALILVKEKIDGVSPDRLANDLKIAKESNLNEDIP